MARLTYRPFVGPWTGAAPSEEVDEFNSLSIKSNHYTGSEISFNVDGYSVAGALIVERVTDVWLFVGEPDEPSALDHRFRVISATPSWDGDGGKDVAVSAVSYKRLVMLRNLMADLPAYTDVRQDAIVWNLIAHTQSQDGGDLGITQGTLDSAALRTRTEYTAGKNIGTLLDQLSQVEGGPHWDINAALELDVRDRDDFDTMTTPIMLGDTASKMNGKTGGYANAALALGNRDTTPVMDETVDIATDPAGRWETVISAGSETNQTVVAERAAGALVDGQSPIGAWTFDIEPDRFGLDVRFPMGAFFDLVVPDSGYLANGVPSTVVRCQLVDRSVTVGSDGSVRASYAAVEIPS